MTCRILITGEPRRTASLESRNGGNGISFERVSDPEDLEARLAKSDEPVMVVAGPGSDGSRLEKIRREHPDVPVVFEDGGPEQLGLSDILDRYDQMRTDFLARLSHEVRSPLGVVVGVLGELEATLDMDEDTRQLLALADRGVRRLRNLSEGLMEVAELESLTSKTLQVDRQPTDMRDVVRAAVDRVRAAESRSGIEVVVDLPDEPVEASVDARRMERVTSILVSNAIRFATKRAEIALRPIDGQVRIVAEDDGPGIPPEMRGDLFRRFVGRHLSGRKSGVAFGLSIAHDYVVAHHGTIQIEDARPDASEGELRGTRVTVTTPR